MGKYILQCGVLAVFLFVPYLVKAQFLMDLPDTTEVIKLSGYIQPQFQLAERKGTKTYNGGDFPQQVNNRFMLRRGRIRFDYLHNNIEKKSPAFQFALQLDGTERGVFIRDLWGKVFENKWQLFSLTTGMFARPFGYEINYSSADRESPERGRMSQILMKTERDLGVMASFQPRKAEGLFRRIQVDAGFFNGQGLTAFSDFDSHKDFISRASVKAIPLGEISLSAGISYFNGGFLQNNRFTNKTTSLPGLVTFSVDSSFSNVGRKAPRKYKGADMQLKWKRGKSTTELRGEYWQGIQTAVASDTETPGSLPDEPYYVRKFNGAFFYLLHQLSKHHQVAIKYDWYDPNTEVESGALRSESRFTEADIKYQTIGFGYISYFNENLKVMLWYDMVKNEKTGITVYREDVDDNVFTCRLQFRF